MRPDSEIALEDQIRECFGRTVYTHKTHERMADICTDTLSFWKKSQIFLAAITSTGAVSVVFFEPVWIEYATAAVALAATFTSGYLKSFDPGGAAQKHRDTAAKLWNIRECYQSLLTDLWSISREAAIARRDELQAALSAIYSTAPRTNSKAYRDAQKRLKELEDMTFSDCEIDSFLPYSLKRSGGRPRNGEASN